MNKRKLEDKAQNHVIKPHNIMDQYMAYSDKKVKSHVTGEFVNKFIKKQPSLKPDYNVLEFTKKKSLKQETSQWVRDLHMHKLHLTDAEKYHITEVLEDHDITQEKLEDL